MLVCLNNTRTLLFNFHLLELRQEEEMRCTAFILRCTAFILGVYLQSLSTAQIKARKERSGVRLSFCPWKLASILTAYQWTIILN